jgi:hypothetical protein
MIVIIRIDDLPEGATAIRLPSGEIIQIDTTQNSLELSISRRDINEDGELAFVALGEENISLGSYVIDLSKDAWQNNTFNGKTGLGSMFIWIAAGVLVIGGAATAIFISLSRKKR